MKTLIEFPNKAAALAYRGANGVAGWIFVDDNSGIALLFPPDVAPIDIYRNSIVAGKSGALIPSA